MIRPPRGDELERLRDIERAAGQAFVGVGMPEIAADPPPSVEVLEAYRLAGRAWVVTAPPGGSEDDGMAVAQVGARDGGRDGDGLVVAGYVIVDVLDRPDTGSGEGRSAHIAQVSVDPRFAGRGLGAQLVDHVAAHARQEGLDAVTLTTFRDVPWNAPYYQRRGFRMLGDDELGPGLRRVRDDEAALGLEPAVRVCMRRDL